MNTIMFTQKFLGTKSTCPLCWARSGMTTLWFNQNNAQMCPDHQKEMQASKDSSLLSTSTPETID